MLQKNPGKKTKTHTWYVYGAKTRTLNVHCGESRWLATPNKVGLVRGHDSDKTKTNGSG